MPAAKDDRSVDRLIVISDDLAIPLGTIRVRPKGTHGGQNGLRSIIDRLGTQEFKRVRIGIMPEHPIADASTSSCLRTLARATTRVLKKYWKRPRMLSRRSFERASTRRCRGLIESFSYFGPDEAEVTEPKE